MGSESAAIAMCKFFMNEGARINIYDPKVTRDQMYLDLTEPGLCSNKTEGVL
jgi:UDPglucose 6-dehydrogenase